MPNVTISDRESGPDVVVDRKGARQAKFRMYALFSVRVTLKFRGCSNSSKDANNGGGADRVRGRVGERVEGGRRGGGRREKRRRERGGEKGGRGKEGNFARAKRAPLQKGGGDEGAGGGR